MSKHVYQQYDHRQTPADNAAGAPAEPVSEQPLDDNLMLHIFRRQMSMIGHTQGNSFGNPEAHVNALAEEVQPRDPVERMVLMQMVITHGRAAHLAHLAARSPEADMDLFMRLQGNACSASSAFCRMVKSLSDLRKTESLRTKEWKKAPGYVPSDEEQSTIEVRSPDGTTTITPLPNEVRSQAA